MSDVLAASACVALFCSLLIFMAAGEPCKWYDRVVLFFAVAGIGAAGTASIIALIAAALKV